MSESATSGLPDSHRHPPATSDLAGALAEIGAGAADLDRRPSFPSRAFESLRSAGALTWSAAEPVDERLRPAQEWGLVRAVAAADASVGRIFDGHLNAIERIRVAAPPATREEQFERLLAESRLYGVWGADPVPGEGEPARLRGPGHDLRVTGSKTFCSGAGGVDAALLLVRTGEPGPPRLCLVEMDATTEVDRGWFSGSGLRASESHRVSFDGTPVVALLGEPGEIGRDPWFSRDALRTSASWAGMADSASASALAELAAFRSGEELASLAAGRISTEMGTIDAWLAAARAAVERDEPLRALSIKLRAAVIGACESLLSVAADACGSRPFAVGSALDRSRRDLQLFTLQHRIDPLLVREGRRLLDPGTAQ